MTDTGGWLCLGLRSQRGLSWETARAGNKCGAPDTKVGSKAPLRSEGEWGTPMTNDGNEVVVTPIARRLLSPRLRVVREGTIAAGQPVSPSLPLSQPQHSNTEEMRGMHAPTTHGGGPPRSGRRLGRIAALAVFALVTASCGGNDDGARPPETLDPPAETTTSSTSAPATSSSTTAAQSTTTLSPEEEVLEVHRRYMTEFFARDERTLTLEERNSRLAAITVDPLLARGLERGAEREAEGSYAVSPGYESNVVEVQVDGETAFVLDCSLDRGVLYDSAGEVLEPPDEEYRLRRTAFVLTDRGWFVSDFFTGGDVCTPGA